MRPNLREDLKRKKDFVLRLSAQLALPLSFFIWVKTLIGIFFLLLVS